MYFDEGTLLLCHTALRSACGAMRRSGVYAVRVANRLSSMGGGTRGKCTDQSALLFVCVRFGMRRCDMRSTVYVLHEEDLSRITRVFGSPVSVCSSAFWRMPSYKQLPLRLGLTWPLSTGHFLLCHPRHLWLPLPEPIHRFTRPVGFHLFLISSFRGM